MKPGENSAMRFLAPLCLLCLLAPLQSAPARSQTQFEMSEAAGKDYMKADAELNRVYKQLYAKLSAADRKDLIAAQQAWVRFRDADAEFRAAESRGGTMHPMVVNGFRAEMTRSRTQQLSKWAAEAGR